MSRTGNGFFTLFHKKPFQEGTEVEKAERREGECLQQEHGKRRYDERREIIQIDEEKIPEQNADDGDREHYEREA